MHVPRLIDGVECESVSAHLVEAVPADIILVGDGLEPLLELRVLQVPLSALIFHRLGFSRDKCFRGAAIAELRGD